MAASNRTSVKAMRIPSMLVFLSVWLGLFFLSASCQIDEKESPADSGNKWDVSLHKALVGTTRLHICSGEGCGGSPEAVMKSFEVSEAEAISEFVNHIAIDPLNSGFVSACLGDANIEFIDGNKVLASLVVISGQDLRWLDGEWEGDGRLTEESAFFLACWLERRGINGPKKELENGKKLEKRDRMSEARWLAAMPVSLTPFWKDIRNRSETGISNQANDIQKMDLALSRQFSNKKERILALLKWFGSGEGPWSGFPAYEEIAEDILLLYKTGDILLAIGEEELTGEQIEGAARFFGSWAFSKNRPADLALLSDALRQALLEHSMKSENKNTRIRAEWAFGNRKTR